MVVSEYWGGDYATIIALLGPLILSAGLEAATYSEVCGSSPAYRDCPLRRVIPTPRSDMCCGFYLSAQEGDLHGLAREVWGEPSVILPAFSFDDTMLAKGDGPHRQILPNKEILVKAEGTGHAIDKESWVKCLKYAYSIWCRAQENGIPAVMRQGGIPCPGANICEADGSVHMERLCKKGLGETNG